MNGSAVRSSRLVIDANIAVWALAPLMGDERGDSLRRLQEWRVAGIELVAPVLWLAESTSVLRKGVFLKQISAAYAKQAVHDLFALPVVLEPLTEQLCNAALDWAMRLGQSKAYDSIYLALADQLSAELWTGDQRLFNAARQAKADYVHWIGES